MLKLVLVGGGNIATHLAKVFKETPTVDLLQVYVRNTTKGAHMASFAPITNSYTALVEADVFMIAVNDDAIAEVSDNIPYPNKLVVHTSGATDKEVLNNKKRGVFYPLQSFTKGASIDFSKIPICIESDEPASIKMLHSLANSISNTVFEMSSLQRQQLHIAAVFVNNFTNYMYQLGKEICDAHQIPFEILHPLITNTCEKIKTIDPLAAQTGPARRKDKKTVALHQENLTDEKLNIYQLLSAAIAKKY